MLCKNLNIKLNMVSRGVFCINVNEPTHSKAFGELVDANLDMLVMSFKKCKEKSLEVFVEVLKFLRFLKAR